MLSKRVSLRQTWMYVSFRISPHYSPHSFHRLKPLLATERSALKGFCQRLRYERPTWCHLLFYFNYYALNMFRTLIYPSSGNLQPATRTPPNISRSKNCNTQRTENKTTDVIIHQQSRRLLKMDILMSETCWAHNWNKITSDIKLVFHSSTIAMMHGPINIRFCQRLSDAKTKTVDTDNLPLAIFEQLHEVPTDQGRV